jgi:alpha-beta hydrolase superfamily lysophospholipase
MKQLYPKFMIILSLFFAFFILFNLVAYHHASAMLNFTQPGKRTEHIESLSFWQKVKILLTGVNIPKPFNTATPDDFKLSFETHRINVNNSVELDAWYIHHPLPKGFILLFHSYASSKSSLLPTARVFHDMGYDTFLVDFRGSGGSNQSTTTVGYYEADDVTKAVEYVQNHFSNTSLILFGQSMGSGAILRAIYANNTQPHAVIIEGVFSSLLATVKNRFSMMGLPSFPTAHFLVFWGGVQNRFSGFRHNPVDYATKVQCPVLMLHGTEDHRATIDEAKAVFENLGGQKRFERFVGAGHLSYLTANPEKWKRIVSQFLAQN